MDLTTDIQVYDHEIPALEKVSRILNEKVASRRDAEDFRREIVGRFAEIGFVVETKVFVPADTPYGKEPDFVTFNLALVGRCDPQPFDHERQAAEVRADILDLGTGGTIKAP